MTDVVLNILEGKLENIAKKINKLHTDELNIINRIQMIRALDDSNMRQLMSEQITLHKRAEEMKKLTSPNSRRARKKKQDLSKSMVLIQDIPELSDDEDESDEFEQV